MDNKYLIVMFDEEDHTFNRMYAESNFAAYRFMTEWVQREIDNLGLANEIKWKLGFDAHVGVNGLDRTAAIIRIVSAELHPAGRNSMYWYIFEL